MGGISGGKKFGFLIPSLAVAVSQWSRGGRCDLPTSSPIHAAQAAGARAGVVRAHTLPPATSSLVHLAASSLPSRAFCVGFLARGPPGWSNRPRGGSRCAWFVLALEASGSHHSILQPGARSRWIPTCQKQSSGQCAGAWGSVTVLALKEMAWTSREPATSVPQGQGP